MSKAHPPELKKFMDKKLSLKLNGGRHVQGILRGFDPFMNLVVDDCIEMSAGGQQNPVGMVVSTLVSLTESNMSSEEIVLSCWRLSREYDNDLSFVFYPLFFLKACFVNKEPGATL
ncbi:hypothetical protein QTP86_022963 [Hemibagrus guttatus]|nr:hypothetical protein QTP86_022963 [Hemibagrus guttatus]